MKILTLTFTKIKSQNRCTLMYTYKHSEVTYRINTLIYVIEDVRILGNISKLKTSLKCS